MLLRVPFVIGFGVGLLLLFGQAWNEAALGYAWGVAVAILVLGIAGWFMLHLLSETLVLFQSWRAKVVALAALLILFTVTAVLSVGYLWVLLVTLVLCGCLIWRGACDYAQLFRRPKPVAGPANWAALEQGQLPAANQAQRDRARKKFSNSLEIRGQCVARTGQYGLINHPLKLDE
jgi:hypothetical protein